MICCGKRWFLSLMADVFLSQWITEEPLSHKRCDNRHKGASGLGTTKPAADDGCVRAVAMKLIGQARKLISAKRDQAAYFFP
jgi:hypothetical protein